MAGQLPPLYRTDAPDYQGLSLLKPAPGRSMAIGPGLAINLADASPYQTIAANTMTPVSMTAPALSPGVWIAPLPNQAVLIEWIRCGIIARDTSAKLQILTCQMSIEASQNIPVNLVQVLPFTFPALVGATFMMCSEQPVPILLPRPPQFVTFPNGPGGNVTLSNTDAAAHTYQRFVTFAYRIVDNIDLTSGPAIAGISGEFR